MMLCRLDFVCAHIFHLSGETHPLPGNQLLAAESQRGFGKIIPRLKKISSCKEHRQPASAMETKWGKVFSVDDECIESRLRLFKLFHLLPKPESNVTEYIWLSTNIQLLQLWQLVLYISLSYDPHIFIG